MPPPSCRLISCCISVSVSRGGGALLQSSRGPFVALGGGRGGRAPVSCGVTNVGRQRQGGGGRRPIAREPRATRLGSGPPLCAVAARYLPTTCAAVRGPSGPNLLFWREGSPQILLMRSSLPFNVFIYRRQWPCSVLKWEGVGTDD